MNKGTQENLGKPHPERQTLIELNGKSVWIDNEFVNLIRELNQVGLITRSHCAGHESENAFLVIRTNNIDTIEIRDWSEEYKEIVISWKRSGRNSRNISVEAFREAVEKHYRATPTGCGGSFGEILCWEIHENGQTFLWLAKKWGISVSFLGELIADHCVKLEPLERSA